MIKTIEAITHDFQGDLFVDIGGNVGMWSTQMVDLYNQIFFVEPSELAINEAKKRIAMICEQKNIPLDRVQYFKNICSDTVGKKKEIFATTQDTGNFSIYAKDLYGQQHVTMSEGEIETITLDSLIPKVPKDAKNVFVKIDTEGADIDILLGGLEFIKKFKPTIVVEAHYHMCFEEEKHTKVFDILLNELEYDLTEFKNPGYSNSPTRVFDHVHTGTEMFDMHFQMILRP